MHFSALIFATRDAVLEAPSPFHSIRFPGHSVNSFFSSLSSLYIILVIIILYRHLPTFPLSQLYRYYTHGRHKQPDALFFLLSLLFSVGFIHFCLFFFAMMSSLTLFVLEFSYPDSLI